MILLFIVDCLYILIPADLTLDTGIYVRLYMQCQWNNIQLLPLDEVNISNYQSPGYSQKFAELPLNNNRPLTHLNYQFYGGLFLHRL